MSDNTPPELPRDPWRTERQPNPTEIRRDTDKSLEALPPSLQLTLLTFFRDISRTVVGQHTEISGNNVGVRVSAADERFYKDRLKEVVESGVVNPHVNPPVRIV